MWNFTTLLDINGFIFFSIYFKIIHIKLSWPGVQFLQGDHQLITSYY